MATTHSIMTI